MKICCLVKEVPDAAVQKRIDSNTKRLDRSGEKNLNPFDTHGIEAAMQIREGGKVEVDEIVSVTMGPESAVRALHKAVALGADRSIHLTDEGHAQLGRMRDENLRSRGKRRGNLCGKRRQVVVHLELRFAFWTKPPRPFRRRCQAPSSLSRNVIHRALWLSYFHR